MMKTTMAQRAWNSGRSERTVVSRPKNQNDDETAAVVMFTAGIFGKSRRRSEEDRDNRRLLLQPGTGEQLRTSAQEPIKYEKKLTSREICSHLLAV